MSTYCVHVRLQSTWLGLGDLVSVGLTSKRTSASWRAPRTLRGFEASSLKEEAA